MNSTPIFEPSLLSPKNQQGITQYSMDQLTNWVLGKGNSIKVQYVPDQLTEAVAKQTFSYIGKISKIVFEPDGTSRNMRVYFSEWATSYESYAIRNTIAMHYPQKQPIQCWVNMGADIGAVTNSGGTPLYWARRFLEEDDPMINYLVSVGAPEGTGPEGE